MEIAEGRQRRANAGNLLRELLEKGLDSGEEKLLQEYDEATTDSSFTSPSDEETDDDADTDFSAEEEEGTLKGELVETEATAQREERRERREEKQRRMRRLEKFGSIKETHGVKRGSRGNKLQAKVKVQKNEKKLHRVGSDTNSTDNEDGEEADDEKVDLRRVVRHRAPPTIPLATRLAEAHARAQEVRRQQQLLADTSTDNEEQKLSPVNAPTAFPFSSPKGQRAVTSARRVANARMSLAAGEPFSATVSPHDRRMWLYAGPVPQRVGYHSGRTVMDRYHVPVVISFSKQLPSVFQS